VSSFDLDLPALRAVAEDFEAIEQAWLQVRPGGVLEVRLQERVPAMVWRHAGGVDLIDATGHRVAQLASREARADLPLIAGEGAPLAVAEARLLWAAAAPLQTRIRGLVRVGERRWDLVLDRDQRILLPEHGALGALERVLALDATQGLLSRDLRIVDLRNPSRPVLRLSAEALADLNHNRSSLQGAVRP
jgi:cell division protein FtsQ